MYWNAAQATAELDKGIGLIENQVNQIVQIEEADGGWVDEELLATRGLARFARSLISEGGLGEIKGLGMSSLALEEDLFRNRIKCTNNLKYVGMSHLSFAQDNAGRMPWQLTPTQLKNHRFADRSQTLNIERIWRGTMKSDRP